MLDLRQVRFRRAGVRPAFMSAATACCTERCAPFRYCAIFPGNGLTAMSLHRKPSSRSFIELAISLTVHQKDDER